MSLFQAIVLGVVQGITEFFPVSSSGHLVLMQALFGIKEPELAFDIFLHMGTLSAILIFFRKDILNILFSDRKLFFHLVLASIPTVIIAILFKDTVEKFFAMPKVVGWMLLLTGLWLIQPNLWRRHIKAGKDLGVLNSLAIGMAQGLAIIPGISRSGLTITTGLLSGLSGGLSFRFSFLLAIPAISGATLLKAQKIGQALAEGGGVVFLAGGITATAVGLAAISLLLRLVNSGRLYLFGIYCILLALVVII